jgi:general nucleoside transport system ATP-binding protein
VTGSSSDPALTLEAVRKIYPNGTEALRGVSMRVARGRIHAIVGENGAGKSTLMRIIAELEQPTEGSVSIGVPSVGMVHQHFSLVPSFTVAEAVALGAEPVRRGLFDRRAARERVRDLSKRYSLDVVPDARIRDLSVAGRQKVEILKALARDSRLLILDEPTAVLSPPESRDLFERLKTLRDEGRTILFISHKVAEVLSLADDVTAIRSGRVEGGGPVRNFTPKSLAELVIGAEVPTVQRKARRTGATRLALAGIGVADEDASDRLEDVTLVVAAGEIVGVAGVDGNGQRGLADVLSGARVPDSGTVSLNGKMMNASGAAEWRNAGAAHLPSDRFAAGGAPDLSLRDNAIAARDFDRALLFGPFIRPKAAGP